MRDPFFRPVLLGVWLLAAACSRNGKPVPDTGGQRDTGSDSGDPDTGGDTGRDTAGDTGRDSGVDTAVDTGDSGVDTAPDTGADTAAVDDRTGLALCGGGGRATDGAYTSVACVAPLDPGTLSVATDGTHVIQVGPLLRVAP